MFFRRKFMVNFRQSLKQSKALERILRVPENTLSMFKGFYL